MFWFGKKDSTADGPSRPLRIAFIVIALAIICVFFYLSWRQRQLENGWITLGDNERIAVEVANTPATRQRGLSGREGLADGRGMLFLFPAADRYGFWMREMKFPIDIIWIRDGVVVDFVTEAAPPAAGEYPPTFYPREKANWVLEVPAGYCQAHGLRTGLPVQFQRLSRSQLDDNSILP